MAIAHAAADYMFADMLVKENGSEKNKQRDVRVNLSVDQLVSCSAVGLPLLLISLAFAQEVTVGTQISCFSPTSFSWRQAAYVDSYCWAAVQTQDTDGLPLWLHKFFPYFLLLAAVLVYLPVLLWRLTAAQVLSNDLSFIMDELDRSYNRAINLAKCLHTANTSSNNATATDALSSLADLTASCTRYPLVKKYLETKRYSKVVLLLYLLCRVLTLMVLFLVCLYLGYYIRLSVTDEFRCNIRSGVLQNDSSIPEAMQCKLVAVGVFRLLSYVNFIVYLLLAPVCVYAMLVPFRSSAEFLKPYEMLPTHNEMEFGSRKWDDLTVYLLFLQENLNQLQSYKCIKVLEMLQKCGENSDILELLQALAKGKGDVQDGRVKKEPQNSDNKIRNCENQENCLEMKEAVPLLATDRDAMSGDEVVRYRVA